MTTMTRDEVTALAPLALTRPGESTVPVRMQTEHLYAVENHLEDLGIPRPRIDELFLGLHRFDEVPLQLWIGAVTEACNHVLSVSGEVAPAVDETTPEGGAS